MLASKEAEIKSSLSLLHQTAGLASAQDDNWICTVLSVP